MRIEGLKSNRHRATITQAELHYVGSITIDDALRGERNTGTVCLNGQAARKAQVGDGLIIISYSSLDVDEAKKFKPWIIFPNPDNQLS